jgi:hypothetical protein
MIYYERGMRPAEASGIQNDELWPRVEILRSFVLSKLRRFLHFVQNRVEMRGSLRIWAFFEGPLERDFGWILGGSRGAYVQI